MIVIGASSGGLKAMFTLLRGLPKTFSPPVAVVLHRHKEAEDSLQAALQRHCALPLAEPMDKESIQSGHVYIAPADYHLLVEPTHFSLSIDEPVLYARPSIDVLFETAAEAFGEKTVGVILTGAGHDGARGAAQIQQRGGRVIVQDPATAEYPMMPSATALAVPTCLMKPIDQIAASLIQISQSAIKKSL